MTYITDSHIRRRPFWVSHVLWYHRRRSILGTCSKTLPEHNRVAFHSVVPFYDTLRWSARERFGRYLACEMAPCTLPCSSWQSTPSELWSNRPSPRPWTIHKTIPCSIVHLTRLHNPPHAYGLVVALSTQCGALETDDLDWYAAPHHWSSSSTETNGESTGCRSLCNQSADVDFHYWDHYTILVWFPLSLISASPDDPYPLQTRHEKETPDLQPAKWINLSII